VYPSTRFTGQRMTLRWTLFALNSWSGRHSSWGWYSTTASTCPRSCGRFRYGSRAWRFFRSCSCSSEQEKQIRSRHTTSQPWASTVLSISPTGFTGQSPRAWFLACCVDESGLTVRGHLLPVFAPLLGTYIIHADWSHGEPDTGPKARSTL
jgi:hypothetical protein